MFGKKSSNGYHEILAGINIKTIVFGEKTLMTEFVLRKGSQLPEHTHNHEQTGYLIKGKMKMYLGSQSRILNSGDSWCVPSNRVHKADVLEDSLAIEVFSPNREEYLKYLNKEDIEE